IDVLSIPSTYAHKYKWRPGRYETTPRPYATRRSPAEQRSSHMTAHATSSASASEDAEAPTTISVHYQGRTPAFRRYVIVYAIANLGIALLWGTITTIILPLHVQGLEF